MDLILGFRLPSGYASTNPRQPDQAEIGDHIPVPRFQDFIAIDAGVLARPSDQDLDLGPFVNGAALANHFLGHRGRITQLGDARLIHIKGFPWAESLVQRLSLSPAALQLIDCYHDLAPDDAGVVITSPFEVVSSPRRAVRRFIPMLIDHKFCSPKDVCVVDHGNLWEVDCRRIILSTPVRFRCSIKAFAIAWQSCMPGSCSER